MDQIEKGSLKGPVSLDAEGQLLKSCGPGVVNPASGFGATQGVKPRAADNLKRRQTEIYRRGSLRSGGRIFSRRGNRHLMGDG